MLQIWKQRWKDGSRSSDLPENSVQGSLQGGMDPSSAMNDSVANDHTMRVAGDDKLSSHLPETGTQGEPEVPYLSYSPESVLESVQVRNSIAVVPPDIGLAIGTKYLIWASQCMRRGKSLVIVHNEATAQQYTQALKEECPYLQVMFYNDPSNLVSKANMLITFSAFLPRVLIDLRLSELHSIVIHDAQFVRDSQLYPGSSIAELMAKTYAGLQYTVMPRVLAIITLPLAYFDNSMLKLEQLLQAKTVGVSSELRHELKSFPTLPTEKIIVFDHTTPGAEQTSLTRRLKSLMANITPLEKEFVAADCILDQIGSIPVDMMWRQTAEEEKWDLDPIIRDTIRSWTFPLPSLDAGLNVTPKFARLVQLLRVYSTLNSFRGIIFVQQSCIGIGIVNLLYQLDDLKKLGPLYISSVHLQTVEDYMQLLKQFTEGSCRLVVAEISTTDLGLPKASVVVCYDVFSSQLSYALARSCVTEGDFIQMVSRESDEHRRILAHNVPKHPYMQRWMNEMCQNGLFTYCPPAFIQYAEPIPWDGGDEFIYEPITNSRLYPAHALAAVLRFALENHRAITSPLFTFTQSDDGIEHECLVHLKIQGIPDISGSSCVSPFHARRLACYRACKELAISGLMCYEWFCSRYYLETSSPTAAMFGLSDPPHPLLAIKNLPAKDEQLHGTRQYLKAKPYFIKAEYPLFTHSVMLYPVVITIPEATPFHAPLVLFTRHPLPSLPEVKLLFLESPARAILRPAKPVVLRTRQLQLLADYSLRLCRSIVNKPYMCDAERMQYFFAPLTSDWSFDSQLERPDICNYIQWDLIAIGGKEWCTPLTFRDIEALEEEIEDAIILDRVAEFTRRYSIVKVRKDLTPLSKIEGPFREAEHENLLEDCKARQKSFEGIVNFAQPILEVCRVPPFFDRLNPHVMKEANMPSPVRFLIPELCTKFSIPASTFRTALVLPCIVQRIEDILIVKEINSNLFQNIIEDKYLHVALSTPAAGTEDNYERLELLGDAFLKYLSSVYVFVANPTYGESVLHHSRQKIISNRTLFLASHQVGLIPYILSRQFSIRGWFLPGFWMKPEEEKGDTNHLSGRQVGEPQVVVDDRDSKPRKRRRVDLRNLKWGDEDVSQWIGDKTVADVAEAVIGAAYLSGGRDVALRVTKLFGIFPPHPKPAAGFASWSDFSLRSPIPNKTQRHISRETIRDVGALTGVDFQYGNRPHVLVQALTHVSKGGQESACNYERLEFLGDAILEFMVIRYIYSHNDDMSPGGMSMLKGMMVSNVILCAICVNCGLHKYLITESLDLDTRISNYIRRINAARTSYAHTGVGYYWQDPTLDPPKILSDLMESIIGAAYVVSSFNSAESFFDNILRPFYVQHVMHPQMKLDELNRKPCILFKRLRDEGCMKVKLMNDQQGEEGEIMDPKCSVMIHQVVLGTAQDRTVVAAARMACSNAWDTLEHDPGIIARSCNCKRTQKGKVKTNKHGFRDMLHGFQQKDKEEIMPRNTTVTEAL